MRYLQTATAALLLLTITACNTMEGLGEDIRAAGDALDKKAEQNNPYREEKQRPAGRR